MTEDTISLREYVDSKLNSIERATTLATAAMDKRLEAMNEFRDQLKDQASRFITRDELTAIDGRIEADIRILREAKATMDGKASQQSVNTAFVFSSVGILFGIIGIIMQLLNFK